MSVIAYRTEKPVVLIRRNGGPATELMERRISFRYIDRYGKRDKCQMVFADPDRMLSDTDFLQPDEVWTVRWGYIGELSKARTLVLKKWNPNYDGDFPKVVCELNVSKGRRSKTEPHRSRVARVWTDRPKSSDPRDHPFITQALKSANFEDKPSKGGGKSVPLTSTQIAKRIAQRHRLKFKGDDADDASDEPYVQPANMSDFEFLQMLATDIDFEFFIEGDVLYYRAKPYDERPRRVFYFHPKNGEDHILTSFRPTVKVSKKAHKPLGSDTKNKDEKAVSDITKIKKSDLNLTSLQSDILEQEAKVADAQAIAKEKALEFRGSATAAEAQARYPAKAAADAYLQGQVALLQTIRKDAEAQIQAAQDRVNASKQRKVNGDARGPNCASDKQKHKGTTPTGELGYFLDLGNERREKVDFVDGPSASSGRRNNPKGMEGANEGTVQTADTSKKKRKKIACAKQQQYQDKAVEAQAVFSPGLPSLRAKVNYEIRGVGARFQGNWYARESVHSITDYYTITMRLKKGVIKKPKKKAKGDKKKEKKAAKQAPPVHQVVLDGARAERVIRAPSVPES